MAHPGKNLRRYFISGLLIWLPIWATYVVIKFIIQLMDSSLKMLPERYQPHQLFGVHIPGLGLIITLLILFFTGMLAANFVGDRIIKIGDRLLMRIPLIRSIYSAVKQVTEALLQPSGKSFRKVLLIEFPRKGVWSIAFQTSENFVHAPAEGNHITVFMPTTPNPTSGFLMIIPEDDVIELDMSIEDGLKTIISLGAVNTSKTSFNMNNM